MGVALIIALSQRKGFTIPHAIKRLILFMVYFLSLLSKQYIPTICFIAENDPNHTSLAARKFLEESSVNWWHILAESPDLNPIDNLLA